MYVVVFNWRAVPLVFGALALGVGCTLLTLKANPDGAVFVGIAVAGLTLLLVDYFLWRRRAPGGPPMWRLIYPAAGGHVFFVPCWVWGGLALVLAVLGFSSMDEEFARSSTFSLLLAMGVLGLLLPPIVDFIRPYDRFRWAAPEPDETGSITPR